MYCLDPSFCACFVKRASQFPSTRSQPSIRSLQCASIFLASLQARCDGSKRVAHLIDGGRVRRLRKQRQHTQNRSQQVLKFALVLGVLFIPGVLPCVAQPKPDSAATLEIYGFAMLDNGYNAGTIDPNWFDVMRPSKLPAFNDEFGRNANWFAGVRQTRLGFRADIPAGKHVVKAVVDFDFFGVG